jgi:hypothetical protein
MRRGKRWISTATAAAFVAASLAGCSQVPVFPALPDGDVIGRETLTPAEQDAEIKELADAQVQNTAEAGGKGVQPQYIPASTDLPE